MRQGKAVKGWDGVENTFKGRDGAGEDGEGVGQDRKRR